MHRRHAARDLALDAYRALNFLAHGLSSIPTASPCWASRRAAGSRSTSVERGTIEQASSNEKFRAAVAFYPPCLGFKDNMTVPTLILIGELDDWTPAEECRNMVDGRDD